MTVKNLLVLILATLIVVANGFIGHYYAPRGITLTPVVLIVISALVCFGAKTLRPILKSAFVFMLIVCNDVLIKLYSGGTHDSEGQGFITAALFAGLLPAAIMLIFSIYRDKQAGVREKVIAYGLFPALIIIYVCFFGHLGLGRNNPM